MNSDVETQVSELSKSTLILIVTLYKNEYDAYKDIFIYVYINTINII